jgi:hypothetical protein
MCAVFIKKAIMKSYKEREIANMALMDYNLHSPASYNGSGSRAEIFPYHIHGHRNHYWIP